MPKPQPDTESAEAVVDECLICCIVQDPVAAQVFISTLKPNEFFTPSLQAIAAAIVSLQAAGSPVEWTSIFDACNGTVPLNYMLQVIAEASPSPAHLSYYARLHSENVARRQFVVQLDAFRSSLDGNRGDIAGPIDELRGVIERFGSRSGSGSAVSIASAIHDLRSAESSPVADAVETGIAGVDYLLQGGMHFGEYSILAGPPSMGKSTLAMQIAARASERHPTLYFSFESPPRDVARAMLTQIDRPLEAAAEYLEQHTLAIVPSIGDGMSTIGAECSAFVKEHGPAFIIVDTINRIYETRRNFESRHRELSYISNRLDSIAEMTNSAVLVIAQLNRGFTNQRERPPRMQDLRDCGELEEHADLIMLLYSKNYDDKTMSVDHDVVLTIGKQRNRSTGAVHLIFDKSNRRFSELATGEPSHAAGNDDGRYRAAGRDD